MAEFKINYLQYLPKELLRHTLSYGNLVDANMLALTCTCLYTQISEFKTNNFKDYILSSYRLLNETTKCGNIEQVKYLIESGFIKLHSYIYNAAVESGNIEILEYLRFKFLGYKSPLDVTFELIKYSCSKLSSYKSQLDDNMGLLECTVSEFKNYQSQLNSFSSKNYIIKFNICKKSVFKAIKNGHIDMIKYIYEKKYVNHNGRKLLNNIYNHALAYYKKDIFEWSSSLGACGNSDTLKAVLSYPQSETTLKWIFSKTIILTSAIYNNLHACCLETFKILLDLNLINDYKNTILYLYTNDKCCKYLIKHVKKMNVDNNTIEFMVYHILRSGNKKSVNWFLKSRHFKNSGFFDRMPHCISARIQHNDIMSVEILLNYQPLKISLYHIAEAIKLKFNELSELLLDHYFKFYPLYSVHYNFLIHTCEKHNVSFVSMLNDKIQKYLNLETFDNKH
jgi:hypothetical protein